jgi:hypothetical protein
VFVSGYAAKKTIATCRELSYVQNVILIDGEKIDDFVVALSDFVKDFGNNDINIEEQVAVEVDMKDQVALIMCSSGTMVRAMDKLILKINLRYFLSGNAKRRHDYS